MHKNTLASDCEPTTDTIVLSICAGDTFSLNGNAYAQTGNYTDTISNLEGCDSIITIWLTVSSPITNVMNVSSCQGDSAELGNKWYHTAGTYIDTFTATGGCDSIVTLNLAYIPTLYQTVTTTICQTNPFYIGGTPYDSTGQYTQTITSWLGCDSVVTLNLTVKPALAVTLNWDSMLVQGQLDATSGEPIAYWCPNGFPNVLYLNGGLPPGGTYSGAGLVDDSLYADSLILAGVTTDTISYYYSDGNGCSQTATGYINLIYCLGVDQVNAGNNIMLYPNPATDQLFIKTEKIQPQTTTIYDVNGRIIQTMPYVPEVDIDKLNSGVYFIAIKGNDVVARKTFVKM